MPTRDASGKCAQLVTRDCSRAEVPPSADGGARWLLTRRWPGATEGRDPRVAGTSCLLRAPCVLD
eukprot:13864794-Alexandrium_andersonii.AAC.1